MTVYQEKILNKLSIKALAKTLLYYKRQNKKIGFTEKEIIEGYINGKTKEGSHEEHIVVNAIKRVYDGSIKQTEEQLKQKARTNKVIKTSDLIQERKRLKIEAGDIAILFERSNSVIAKWEKDEYPDMVKEILFELYDIIKKQDAKKQTSIMKMRWLNGITIEDAAQRLNIKPEELWKMEWNNCCKLNIISKMAMVYHWPEEQIPIKENDKKKEYRKRIKEVRAITRMTQNEAAKNYNIRLKRYKRIEGENEIRPPLYEEIKNIALYYSMNVESFMLSSSIRRLLPQKYDYKKIEYYRKKEGLSEEAFCKKAEIGIKQYKEASYSSTEIKRICELLKVKRKDLEVKTAEIKIKKYDPKKMRQIREQHNVSIGAEAADLGISVSWLIRIENGTGTPSTLIVAKLASLYGKDMAYFC